jgi:hypothetical protein
MKKTTYLSLALVGLLALSGAPAFAELCTIDDVPAATLLLPYFEVDLAAGPAGATTLFDITNASAAAQLAHVVVWTDLSVPVLDFDVYLTGFDVVSLNLRDVINGILPRTAPRSLDAGDVFSPSPPPGATQAAPPRDDDFPNCAGKLPFPAVALNAAQIAHLQAALTGQPSALLGGACSGLDYGDDIARGYITVDNVNECSLEFPSSPGYFAPGGTGIANNNNNLWGNYYYVDPTNNFAQGETLVHIEADATLTDATVNSTFYRRYVAAGEDNREPLATTWAARYIGAPAFPGGTDLIVWREGGDNPADFDGFSCAAGPTWFPLNQTQTVVFDEEENGIEVCIPGDDRVSPPTGEAQTCFPAEAQRVPVGGSSLVPGGDDLPAAASGNGWIYLNLNWQASIADVTPKQSWVTTVMNADGRFSVGMDAIQLDSACTTFAPGVTITP